MARLHRVLRLDRVTGQTRNDRGASAVEWVLITAILVAIALAVGGVLYTQIEGAAENIDFDTTQVGNGGGGGDVPPGDP